MFLMKFPQWLLTLPTNVFGLHGYVLQKVAMPQAPLPRPRCPAIASPPMGAGMRKERAGMTAAVIATATLDGRCVCSYPALYPAVLIQLSSLTSVALHVRVCLSNSNVTLIKGQFQIYFNLGHIRLPPRLFRFTWLNKLRKMVKLLLKLFIKTLSQLKNWLSSSPADHTYFCVQFHLANTQSLVCFSKKGRHTDPHPHFIRNPPTHVGYLWRSDSVGCSNI